ncbi:pyridoxamine 5'-phosphate oxidase family protein [Falsarthrobacter nasiphocae]|uniref:Pyridoxamine 5'-phosphate oxidase n=1 Tax=Falsarthrobacter nasiphocae TaxID=189863 RepID=A0AAE3YF74_9MICC|nr:pyridoxamine 5'-phosphate oxidase family protein [Falsarthrobacter nasiphocae]MDR6892713.1 pyridoxamine 5'-phosphate oxidase [Falsarthrobacter nasiphocae]
MTTPALPVRHRLRALPVFPEIFPAFEADPAAWPESPADAFLGWLDEALDLQVVEPHAATLSTADASGNVTARTLILKDLQGDVWHFATHQDTRKVADLAENPSAALTFYWPETGRQVLVRGEARDLGDEASAEDFRQRPMAGTEIDPLWRAYGLEALSVEFWQADPERQHRRMVYSRASAAEPFSRSAADPGM